MEKYYKTLRTSETGRKFQAMSDKMSECFKAQVAMADKYGFTEWRDAYFAVSGGISSVIFPSKPDVKLWKCKNGEYTPRINNAAGKAIQAEFDNMPRVKRIEVNECIGWGENLSCIGVTFDNPDFFGFVINSSKVKTVPSDCEEITGTEYEKLDNDKSTSK